MPRKNLLIIGAGYVGFSVGRLFVEKGYDVYGVCRTEEKGIVLKSEHIHPIFVNITQKRELTDIPLAENILICSSPDKREPQSYREHYVEAVGNVLNYLKDHRDLKKLIYISSTGVWRDSEGEVIDETAPPNAKEERGKILAEAEKQVLESSLPTLIFRLSGIYGPGRNRVIPVRRGVWPKKGFDYFMNMIHLDDITRAIELLFEKGKIGDIYIGVDDKPVLRSEFCEWLSKRKLVLPDFATVRGDHPMGKRCRNQKLKELGFEFLYPTYREGYATLLRK